MFHFSDGAAGRDEAAEIRSLYLLQKASECLVVRAWAVESFEKNTVTQWCGEVMLHECIAAL